MKLLITLELALLFLATTFQSHNPPGWYQVQLPFEHIIVQDIYFLDSLRGWLSAKQANSNDTAYIVNTTNGGNDWTIQFQDSIRVLNAIQFVDESTGYAAGGFGRAKFLKTTNAGLNWTTSIPNSSYGIQDMKFVNRDTGWVCSDDEFDGGIFRTTNGGTSWQRQTTPSQLRPLKLFFLNRDTGMALEDSKLWRTHNGGNNWSLVYNFPFGMIDLFFVNYERGWTIRNSSNGIYTTTNAGFQWENEGDPFPFNSGLNDIFMLSVNNGMISTGLRGIFSLNEKGLWGKQFTPVGSYFSVQMLDTNICYSGGTGFIKTTDGGGPITGVLYGIETKEQKFELYQNFPNPFNSGTSIKFSIDQRSDVRVDIYDVRGIAVSRIADGEYNEGSYDIRFDASSLASGIYYCVITARTKKESFAKSITMVLTK